MLEEKLKQVVTLVAMDFEQTELLKPFEALTYEDASVEVSFLEERIKEWEENKEQVDPDEYDSWSSHENFH